MVSAERIQTINELVKLVAEYPLFSKEGPYRFHMFPVKTHIEDNVQKWNFLEGELILFDHVPENPNPDMHVVGELGAHSTIKTWLFPAFYAEAINRTKYATIYVKNENQLPAAAVEKDQSIIEQKRKEDVAVLESLLRTEMKAPVVNQDSVKHLQELIVAKSVVQPVVIKESKDFELKNYNSLKLILANFNYDLDDAITVMLMRSFADALGIKKVTSYLGQ